MPADRTSSNYRTANSHFSDDADYGDGSSVVAPGIETSRVLSEEENKRLNEKIDVLLEALTNGRQVHFDRDPITGIVDVLASRNDVATREEGDYAEAQVAAWPQNFGKIIEYHRQMMRSPSSMIDSWLSSEEDQEAANPRDTHGIRPLHQATHRIHQTIRQIEERAREPQGSRFPRVKSNEIEVHHVHPIPLDFARLQQTTTPSVESEGSEVCRSSPLFIKSLHQWESQSARDVIDSPSPYNRDRRPSPSEHISAWLDEIKIENPQKEDAVKRRYESGTFTVLKDPQNAGPTARHTEAIGSSSQVLKDISNLRQPGYLQHNSFAVDKDRTRELRTATEARRGVLNDTSDDSNANDQRQVAIDKTFSLECDLDPDRAAHFELALARLEGRAAPQQSSPIRRHAHPESAYGSDVELEHCPLDHRQPMAMRKAVGDPSLAQQLERMMVRENNERFDHSEA